MYVSRIFIQESLENFLAQSMIGKSGNWQDQGQVAEAKACTGTYCWVQHKN